jgi:DNA (cytosine-5)-methyltransferase 1
MSETIPIIDIFAGPGGLGEGFSAYEGGGLRFAIALSIEKDETAHKTLELRSFFRQFDNPPDEYYQYVSGVISRSELFSRFPEQSREARSEAWCAELGSKHFPNELIDQRIKAALKGSQDWILIGGPPCQAYSLVGRSRMISTHPDFEKDHRHVLYREYLRIIEKHKPQMFVMENVKGLLTSKYDGELIFEKIRRDLTYPWGTNNADGYDIYSLCVNGKDPELLQPEEFIIRSENYGIPQARHRLILLGIRKKSGLIAPKILQALKGQMHVHEAIGDLPILRSRLSTEDNYKKWKSAQKKLITIAKRNKSFSQKFKSLISSSVKKEIADFSGALFIEAKASPASLKKWYKDGRLPGILNHEARSHMESDLGRYLFAACFTKLNDRSPKLTEYPRALLPNHKNARDRKNIKVFADRFRVQRWNAPATTIVSHIAKDGHYYIHPDPTQCRSLTVREAARLQTFPDNYFFEGNRTSQYTQVGNAVPPFLAFQIAKIVADVIEASTSVRGRRKVAAVG